MKYITGFFMAWGNFFAIPCPLKLWDEKARRLMLGFLPSIGLMLGLIWAAVYFGLVYLSFPFMVVSFIMTFLPFALCGFMHMDGFMDCCDAIMSRRPLEDRQRILKDSNVGAFAVLGAIFMILGYFAFLSTAISYGIDFVNIVAISVLSRSVSGIHVLICKPMGSSQYVQMSQEDDNKKSAIILLIIQLVLYLGLIFVFSSNYVATGLVALSTIIGTTIFALYGRKNLGGFNGDIAGFSIVWGEFFGMLSLMFC